MKTVNIKNGLFWNGTQKFRVIINGEEHIMKTHDLDVEVDENAPLEISVKRGWRYSPTYSFEPKDNLLLRITENRQIKKRRILLLFLGFVLFSCIGYFTGISWIFNLSPALMWLFPSIYMINRRKDFFVVQETS